MDIIDLTDERYGPKVYYPPMPPVNEDTIQEMLILGALDVLREKRRLRAEREAHAEAARDRLRRRGWPVP